MDVAMEMRKVLNKYELNFLYHCHTFIHCTLDTNHQFNNDKNVTF